MWGQICWENSYVTHHATETRITELQWLKIHLRLAALEQNGSRLNCRFEFPDNDKENITCRIYFTDDDSKTMDHVSKEERIEIYEGWVAFAMSVVQRAVELAELPPNFIWKPTLQFILHENYGMGASVVHTVERPFTWT
jgi:hypothetical protein